MGITAMSCASQEAVPEQSLPEGRGVQVHKASGEDTADKQAAKNIRKLGNHFGNGNCNSRIRNRREGRQILKNQPIGTAGL